jgi:hypothetical protein
MWCRARSRLTWVSRVKENWYEAVEGVCRSRRLVNLVVVQKESGGEEEGKYITILVSSYQPQSGDDGFTFTNQDGCVSDFRRIRPRGGGNS